MVGRWRPGCAGESANVANTVVELVVVNRMQAMPMRPRGIRVDARAVGDSKPRHAAESEKCVPYVMAGEWWNIPFAPLLSMVMRS